MPDGLPEAAYALTHGLWPEEQRKGVLKPEIRIAADSSAQDKLLAYSGREPSRTGVRSTLGQVSLTGSPGSPKSRLARIAFEIVMETPELVPLTPPA